MMTGASRLAVTPCYRPTISACGDIIVDICTNDDPFTQTTGRNPPICVIPPMMMSRKALVMGRSRRDASPHKNALIR